MTVFEMRIQSITIDDNFLSYSTDVTDDCRRHRVVGRHLLTTGGGNEPPKNILVADLMNRGMVLGPEGGAAWIA